MPYYKIALFSITHLIQRHSTPVFRQLFLLQLFFYVSDCVHGVHHLSCARAKLALSLWEAVRVYQEENRSPFCSQEGFACDLWAWRRSLE